MTRRVRRGSARPALRGRALWWLVQAGAERTGHDLVARNYYSPLPDVDRLPDRAWTAPREVHGVDLRVSAALELLGDLRPYLIEFRSLLEGSSAAPRFDLGNGAYGSVDAEVLYAIIRRFKPERVVELGSGASSHVIWAAQAPNQREGRAFEHRIFDPYPFDANPVGPVSGPSVASVPAELIDSAEITALRCDDVLFVDTTHTVKTGGDVTRIVLDLLPQLAAGVLVQLHDIFLPYEYPRHWVVDERRAWAEQYLLQAFLAFNGTFEVVFPAYALARAAPEQLAAAIPSFGPQVAPGAFWIRRLG